MLKIWKRGATDISRTIISTRAPVGANKHLKSHLCCNHMLLIHEHTLLNQALSFGFKISFFFIHGKLKSCIALLICKIFVPGFEEEKVEAWITIPHIWAACLHPLNLFGWLEFPSLPNHPSKGWPYLCLPIWREGISSGAAEPLFFNQFLHLLNTGSHLPGLAMHRLIWKRQYCWKVHLY